MGRRGGDGEKISVGVTDRQKRRWNSQKAYLMTTLLSLSRRRLVSLLSGALLLSLAPAPRLWAQQLPLAPRIVYQIEGETPGQKFGAGVWALEDVDGDGAKDLLVIDYPDDSETVESAGVYSGADGRALYALDYDFPEGGSVLAGFNTQFGQLGDLDGDGVADFIAGDDAWARDWERDPSFAIVFSGKTGEVIRIHRAPGGLRLGWGTYGLGDLDDDGLTDYAIETAPRNSGEAYTLAIHSGGTGAELATLTTWEQIIQGHRRAPIIGIEDVNGDGRADFAVLDSGRRAIRFVSGALRGQVALDDLPSEWVLGRYDSSRPVYGGYRTPLVNLGDLDGDGFDEVAAAVENTEGGTDVGLVAVSSRTAEELWVRIFTRHSLQGWSFDSVARISDLSGDGVPELVTGYQERVSVDGWPRTIREGVAVLSGADGTELHFFSPTTGEFPRDIRSLSDLDGDRVEEVAISDRHWKEGTGRVVVYSFGPGSRELELSVATGPSGMVIVSWPEVSGEVVLERSEDLLVWEEVALADPQASEIAVSPPSGPAKLFFRLRRR